jgi:hypothetical protein
MRRGLDFLRSEREKVAAAIIRKNQFGDPGTVRKTVYHFSDLYSLSITKEDVESVIAAAGIQAEAKKFGGADKFLAGSVLTKALSQGR